MLPVFTLLSAGWFRRNAVAVFVLWHSYRHVGIDLAPGDWDVGDMPRWLPILALIAVYALLALPIGAGPAPRCTTPTAAACMAGLDAWSGLLWIAIVAIRWSPRGWYCRNCGTCCTTCSDGPRHRTGLPTGSDRIRNLRENNMRKVTAGSLNGKCLPVRRSCLPGSAAYLDKAASQCAGNPDRAEVIADLEQAIADKCDTFLGKHKNVISVEEARQILREMGAVASDTVEPEAAAPAEAPPRMQAPASATAPQRQRRLYRLPGKGVVGGVCSGLAAYFGVDVVVGPAVLRADDDQHRTLVLRVAGAAVHHAEGSHS